MAYQNPTIETLAHDIAEIGDHLPDTGASEHPEVSLRLCGHVPAAGLRCALLPWLGDEVRGPWRRRTLVLPLLGLGAIVIGLDWRLSPSDHDQENQ